MSSVAAYIHTHLYKTRTIQNWKFLGKGIRVTTITTITKA
jgi:hypothetical protein